MTGFPNREEAKFSLLEGVAALLPLLLLVLAGLALVGWSLGPTLPVSDLYGYLIPKYDYAASQFSAGLVPLWNPLEFSGIPFLATAQPGVLYPPIRLLYAVMSGENAYMALFFVHLAMGAVATLALFRSLGCGKWPSVLAALWVAHPVWLFYVYERSIFFTGVVWVPLLILLARRAVLHPSLATAAGLGIVAALEAMSGYPPMTLAAGYVLVLGLPFWLLERGRWDGAALWPIFRTLLLAVFVAGLLASPQWLPTAELLASSDRFAEAEAKQASLLETPPEVLRAWHHPANTFSAIALEAWGRTGPVLLLLCLVGLVLRPRSTITGYALALAVVCSLIPPKVFFELPFYGGVRYAVEWAVISPFAVQGLAALGLDALYRRFSPAAPMAFAGLLMALIGSTLWTLGEARQLFPKVYDRPEFAVPASVEVLCDSAPGGARLLWPDTLGQEALLAARAESVTGYEPLLPSRVAAVHARLRGTWQWLSAEGQARLFAENAGLLRRMGLGCLLSARGDPERFGQAGFRLAGESPDGVRIYRYPGGLPRSRLVVDAWRAGSGAEALDAVLGDFLDPLKSVVLEGEGPPLPACSGSPGGASEISAYRAEEVRVRTSSACPAYLVLADTYMPGWTATVDGRPAPIHRADFLFRAVELGPGSHEVVFRYRPRSAVLGAWLFVGGLGLAAALIVLGRRN